MPTNRDYETLVLSLCRDEVALWLGPNWQPPDSLDDQKLLSDQDWLGIWSDAQEPKTAQIITQNRKEKTLSKNFVEVPGSVDDLLQPDFRYSEYCPFFYLNGRFPDSSKLTPAKQTLARLTKLRHLERLTHLTLLVCGFASPQQFIAALTDSMSDFLGKVQHIFLVGIDNSDIWQSQLNETTIAPLLLDRMCLKSEPFLNILKDSTRTKLTEEKNPARQILVKPNISVSLDDVLRTDPPLDQYFHIITADHIAPPSKSENTSTLVKQLLSNQESCWRTFAHELEWKRPVYSEAKNKMDKFLSQLAGAKGEPAEVRCLDVLGEAGSGLSVLLQWLAFKAAKQHYPTILAREGAQPINYGALRRFLIDLDRKLIEKGGTTLPIVVVLGSEVFSNDTTGQMGKLQRLLKRDARRVLLIRGLHDGNQNNVVGFDQKPVKIRTVLDNEEITTLCDWARTICELIDTNESGDTRVNTIQEWQLSSTDIPLLVALDYVLTDDLRDAGAFNTHLLKRLDNYISELMSVQPESDENAGHTVKTKDGPLHITLGAQSWRSSKPTKQHLAEILTVVSALGRLKSFVPRSVLETMISADTDICYQAISVLEKSKLVKIDSSPAGIRIKPRPYYDGIESVRLLHDLYANMLLSALMDGDLGRKLEIQASVLCGDFLDILKNTKEDDQLPVQLLRPICLRLRAGDDEHISYAEFLSMQYLRISYNDEDSARFNLLKSKIDDIVSVYKNLPVAMIRDSVTLLHSRALTCRYEIPLKRQFLTKKDIEQCRQVPDNAEKCLKEALALGEKRIESESPDNLRTSLGYVYRNRAIIEMNHPAGSKTLWVKYLRDAKQCFSDVLKQTMNSYAAYALADLQIRELEIHSKKTGSIGYDDVPQDRLDWFDPLQPIDIAIKLSEAFRLLSVEPEKRFEVVWNKAQTRAMDLLASQEAIKAVTILKDTRNEMGYVLDAMRQLRDSKILKIPEQPTTDSVELQGISRARSILDDAEKKGVAPCPLGELLRYALFSALKERIPHTTDFDPAYKNRYELIKRLKRDDGSLYYDDPIWSYDYAMLAFQNGDIEEGQRMFRRLRASGAFRRVPWERTQIWMDAPDFERHVEGSLKISRLEINYNQGWGYFTSDKYKLKDPVPFNKSMFSEFGPTTQIEVGKTVRCKIRLQPAGTYAFPPRA